MSEEFRLKDCALIAISTGEQAQNLRELRDRLATVHHGCIYYHFWAGLLRPRFDDPEFQNDFAIWAFRSLNDAKLAEQLSMIDPNAFLDLEDLRRDIIEVIEQHLYEREYVPWAKPGNQFYFIRSQIVLFDTGVRVRQPIEFSDILRAVSLGSIFYHFIDARRRTRESKNDLSLWLAGFEGKYDDLIQKLDLIDPYFTTLSDLRSEVADVFHDYFPGEAR